MNQETTQTTFPLPAGTSIVQGQKYTSQSGNHYLLFQTDGNLVINTSSDQRIWGLNKVLPNFSSASRVEMQTDGNLAVYDANGGYLWSALRHLHDPRVHLVLTPGGALQLVASGRKVLWSSDGNLTVDPDPLKLNTLHANCMTCREGLDLLSKNMYTGYETDKEDWKKVWKEFKTKYLPTCNKIGDFIKAHHGELVLHSVEQAMTDWREKNRSGDFLGWDIYFKGNSGIEFHGDRICQYTSNNYTHRRAPGLIQNAISGIRTILDLLDKIEGLPDYGWAHYRKIESPKITIMGTKAVTPAAMDVVKHIYTEITNRFTPSYPLNKLDGYVIYITNGEPWSELSGLIPIGTMWGVDANGVNLGDELRGGTSYDYLWISEQMICKRGVQTRNEAFKAGKRAGKDDTDRTFDQVIHEFGHAIAIRYGLSDRIEEVYAGGWNPVEQFPWSVQHWFGAPRGTLSETQREFMSEIFQSQTTFSCDLYKP